MLVSGALLPPSRSGEGGYFHIRARKKASNDTLDQADSLCSLYSFAENNGLCTTEWAPRVHDQAHYSCYTAPPAMEVYARSQAGGEVYVGRRQAGLAVSPVATPSEKRRPGPRQDLPWAGAACGAGSGLSLGATCSRCLTVHFASKCLQNGKPATKLPDRLHYSRTASQCKAGGSRFVDPRMSRIDADDEGCGQTRPRLRPLGERSGPKDVTIVAEQRFYEPRQCSSAEPADSRLFPPAAAGHPGGGRPGCSERSRPLVRKGRPLA
jgi:hypothetical protein